MSEVPGVASVGTTDFPGGGQNHDLDTSNSFDSTSSKPASIFMTARSNWLLKERWVGGWFEALLELDPVNSWWLVV